MPVADLSHMMENGMTVFPGTGTPAFIDEYTLEKNGFREKTMHMCSHTGTHVDAPAHILDEGASLDMLPPDRFTGTGAIVRAKNTVITRNELLDLEQHIKTADFILIHTQWDRYWHSPDKYAKDFPVLHKEAALFLASCGLKGVGIDAISVDTSDSTDLPVHNILLGAGMVIIENLTNLQTLPDSGFTFYALPLNIKNGDGSPVRAVAVY